MKFRMKRMNENGQIMEKIVDNTQENRPPAPVTPI